MENILYIICWCFRQSTVSDNKLTSRNVGIKVSALILIILKTDLYTNLFAIYS